MTILSDDHNPFRETDLYERLGLDPWLPAETVIARLRHLRQQLETMPPSEREGLVQALDEADRILPDCRHRAIVNALIFDTLDLEHVLALLEEGGAGELGDLRFAELGLDQLIVDGEDPQLNRRYFRTPPASPELELDLGQLRHTLNQEPCELHYIFDM